MDAGIGYSPLEQTVLASEPVHPSSEANAFGSYGSYDTQFDPLSGAHVDPYGSVVSPYNTKVGWIDAYSTVRDPSGGTIGWVDSYDTIRDPVTGTSLGTINAYGDIVGPYG